jgi:hypothetical protein
VNAAVNGISFPFPGRTKAARFFVHLKDAGLKTVHPAVASGRQSGNACADDDDGFIGHGTPHISHEGIPD